MHVQIVAKKVRPSTSGLITGVPPVTYTVLPLRLTSRVTDQWNFTGATPEWSDSEVPALAGTCDLPVIKPLVLGLTLISRYLNARPLLYINSLFRVVKTTLSSSYNISGLVPVCWLLFQCF